MFKNPWSFKGRIRRTEYGLSVLIFILNQFFLTQLLYQFEYLAILIGIYFIALIWFLIAQGIKRCHDNGNSGWYQIIPLYCWWMLFDEGDIGVNKYGPNPKGIGNKEKTTIV